MGFLEVLKSVMRRMRNPHARPRSILVPDDRGVTITREGAVVNRLDWAEVHKIVGGQIPDRAWDSAFVDLYRGENVLRIWQDVEGINDFLGAMYRAFPAIDRGWTKRTLAHDGAYQETLYERGQ